LKEGGPKPYPELCRNCAVPERNAVHDRCDFCRDIALDEGTLCDLTRSVQDPGTFACYAFRPMSGLSLVKNVKDLPDDRKPKVLSSSDSSKYRQALAVQRVRSDPDGVYVHLAYHLAWNVAKRKSLFSHPADARGLIDDAFSACGEEIGGVARVLWLAPDHIYVYVESNGEKSVEAVVKVVRRVSAKALHGLREKGRLWEEAYFAQTIG
jgi:REP element-mobilizing transposase RayT